jgi:hypothetical protein
MKFFAGRIIHSGPRHGIRGIIPKKLAVLRTPKGSSFYGNATSKIIKCGSSKPAEPFSLQGRDSKKSNVIIDLKKEKLTEVVFALPLRGRVADDRLMTNFALLGVLPNLICYMNYGFHG